MFEMWRRLARGWLGAGMRFQAVGWFLGRHLRRRRQTQRAGDHSIQVQIGEQEIR